MKTLTEYLALPYKREIVPDSAEGGYVIAFPELPGCLTCGGYSRTSPCQRAGCQTLLARNCSGK